MKPKRSVAKTRNGQVRPVRGSASRQKSVLYLNGRQVRATQTQVALLECLHAHKGRVVPYAPLCRVIGHKEARDPQLHILRQYAAWITKLLRAHKVPLVLTVAWGTGYALCEAEPRP